MIIDEVMEENEMQDDYDEEEEDLNNIPLFASSEEMVEPPSLVESSLTLPERDSAPQAVSTSLLNSDIRPEDLREEEDIREFFQNGCGCVDECHKKFSESYVRTLRSDMLQMTRSEYDLVIMAQMKATSSMGGLTSGNRKRPHDRERNTFVYQHEGVKVIISS